MNEEKAQTELWEELKVEKLWFHVVRSMIIRGDLKKMGIHAWAVYCVLKAHTDLATGKSWPSQQTIADIIGVSVDTVARATDRLIEMKIVTKEKWGKANRYQLVERVNMLTTEGEVSAIARRDYAPMKFDGFIRELEQFAQRGVFPADKNINITFNVQVINQGDNSTVNVNNVSIDGGSVTGQEHLGNLLKKLKGL